MQQLNLRFAANALYIQAEPDDSMGWDDPACRRELPAKLEKFSAWTPPSSQGLWHLLDDCLDGAEVAGQLLPNGLAGQAYQGGLCNMELQAGKHWNVGVSYYYSAPVVGDVSWRFFAHELGHSCGAGHPFGEVASLVGGGIMAYGPGYYECSLAFHPASEDKMCTKLTGVVGTCSAISTLTSTREEFMLTLPAELKSFDLDVVHCGVFGIPLGIFALVSLLGFCLCCCACCCILRACSRLAGRTCSRNDPSEEDCDEEACDEAPRTLATPKRSRSSPGSKTVDKKRVVFG